MAEEGLILHGLAFLRALPFAGPCPSSLGTPPPNDPEVFRAIKKKRRATAGPRPPEAEAAAAEARHVCSPAQIDGDMAAQAAFEKKQAFE